MVMATVGVLARIDMDRASIVYEQLSHIDGVQIFDAGAPDSGQIGILVEAVSLDEAHDRITHEIQVVEGVLCAWPVYVHLDDDDDDDDDDDVDTDAADGEDDEGSDEPGYVSRDHPVGRIQITTRGRR